MRVILETHGGDAGEAYLHEFCIVPWFDKVRTTFAEEIGVT
jgi:hypothetical protein